jgi:hypothetical protein
MPSPYQQVKEERQIQRVLKDAGASLDHPEEEGLETSTIGDRMTRFATPNMSRMRRTWNAEDAHIIDILMREADQIIRAAFPAAFSLMDRIYEAVRFRAADKETGVLLTGTDGGPLWESDPDGIPKEDWTRISDRDKDTWLWIITTHLFEWEQQKEKFWGRSMYAKGKWEETFSRAFQSGERDGTVEDKTQHGQSAAMESRYFAVFQNMLSRQADALVKSMVRIQGVLERNAR